MRSQPAVAAALRRVLASRAIAQTADPTSVGPTNNAEARG